MGGFAVPENPAIGIVEQPFSNLLLATSEQAQVFGFVLIRQPIVDAYPSMRVGAGAGFGLFDQ